MTTGRFPGKCPTCGEKNDGNMQFCIFCGSSISPKEQQPVKHEEAIQNSTASVPSIQAVSVLVCTVCHRSDPLHGQYCVFCGGRTIAGGGVEATPSIGRNPSTMQDRIVNQPTASGEFPYTHAVPQRRKPPSQSSAAGTIIATVLASILGAGIGFGAVYLLKSNLEPKLLERMWVGDGLIVYTNLPGTNVMVEDHDGKSVYAGITGKTGALEIDNIPAGPYRVSVFDGSRVLHKNIQVANGKFAVLGYPDRIQ